MVSIASVDAKHSVKLLGLCSRRRWILPAGILQKTFQSCFRDAILFAVAEDGVELGDEGTVLEEGVDPIVRDDCDRVDQRSVRETTSTALVRIGDVGNASVRVSQLCRQAKFVERRRR